MKIVYIGLGSNLANPQQQLTNAIKTLEKHPDMMLLQCSSFYRSKALTLNDIPQPDYINAVIEIKTALSAESLLDRLQTIENQQGRVREEKWGARTLDMDILLYAQTVIQNTRLSIPHPHIGTRNFVLVPLHEINPQLNIPNFGNLSTIIKTISMDDLVKIV